MLNVVGFASLLSFLLGLVGSVGFVVVGLVGFGC